MSSPRASRSCKARVSSDHVWSASACNRDSALSIPASYRDLSIPEKLPHGTLRGAVHTIALLRPPVFARTSIQPTTKRRENLCSFRWVVSGGSALHWPNYRRQSESRFFRGFRLWAPIYQGNLLAGVNYAASASTSIRWSRWSKVRCTAVERLG